MWGSNMNHIEQLSELGFIDLAENITDYSYTEAIAYVIDCKRSLSDEEFSKLQYKEVLTCINNIY
jgi:hypothetical protein